MEEELNGGEGIHNEKQDKNIQATQEETSVEEIRDTKTEILNVKTHTQEIEKYPKKKRKPKSKKTTQPTKEEAVVKKIEEVTPEKSIIPDKQMKRIEEDKRAYVKQGKIDLDSSQMYASVNKPHRPVVDNSDSSVLHVYGRARIGQRHPIPLRILCDTGCNIAIVSEEKCKKDQIPIRYQKIQMNVSDVQGTQIKLLGTAVYFISLEKRGKLRRVEAVVAENCMGMR